MNIRRVLCACLLVCCAVLFAAAAEEVCSENESAALAPQAEGAVLVPGATVGNYWLVQHLYCLGFRQEYDSDPAFSVPRLTGGDAAVARTGHKAVYVSQAIPAGAEFVMNGSYCLSGLHGKGSHGEVWRARRIADDGTIDESESYVLKRMRVSEFPDILQCALREVYFGKRFQHSRRIARFVDHFYDGGDMWLVFMDEGISLQQFLYAMRYTPAGSHDQHSFLEPSLFWLKLRTTEQGKEVMRALLLQLVQAATELQTLEHVVHRDIKPSNLLINSEGPPLLKVADFSSALSIEALRAGLYPAAPSADEESDGYQPPEVIFGNVDRADTYLRKHPSAYDSWSVGVVMLEMILGTQNVFSVDQRTQALILQQMVGQPEDRQQRALLLAAMADFCIYHGDPLEFVSTVRFAGGERPHGSSAGRYYHTRKLRLPGRSAPSHPCGLNELAQAIHKRDPLEIGFNDPWGLDLLSRLLAWNASDRMSLSAAHRHAYFVGPYVSELDGSRHATADECIAHDLGLLESDGNVGAVTTAATGKVGASLAHINPSQPGSGQLLLQLRTRMDQRIEEKCSADISVILHPLAKDMADEIRTSYFASARGYSHLIAGGGSHATMALDAPEPQAGGSESDMPSSFACEGCGRTFKDYDSCLAHSVARKHGFRCRYDASVVAPCISRHAMLPSDPRSGWCDLQGRRSRLEDWHSIVFTSGYKFYGVMDGHFGARAAKYASRHLHRLFKRELDQQLEQQQCVDHSAATIRMLDGAVLASDQQLATALRSAFLHTHSSFLKSSPSSDISGTTATVALVFRDVVAVANVGDSSAVACCDDQFRPILLTVDHTPYSETEFQRVIQKGGFIENDGVLRVNGSLAVTRSLGDRAMESLLQHEPSISMIDVQHDGTIAIRNDGSLPPGTGSRVIEQVVQHPSRVPFLIVASDGLWDVLSPFDAVALVASEIQQDLSASAQSSLSVDLFEAVARMLAVEAYVRGSMDNIGVCVVQLSSD